MVRWLKVLVFVFAAGCSFQASCGNSGIDMDKAKKMSAELVENTLGVTVSEVTCPEKVKPKAGEVFTCTAKVGDKSVEVAITHKDDKGNVHLNIDPGVIISYRARAKIAELLEAESGVTVGSVACPEKIVLKAGEVFACTAKVDDIPMVVTVTLKDDKGQVSYDIAQDVLISRRLEAQMVEYFAKNNNVQAKVNCGKRVRPSTPGDRFECKAVGAQGQRAVIAVDVLDKTGGVNWKVIDQAGQ